MNNESQPTGLRRLSLVTGDAIYADPPLSPDPARLQFFGQREDDLGTMLYSIPVGSPIGELVQFFKVGFHNANVSSRHFPPIKRVTIVAELVEKIAELVPCEVSFITDASLKLRFTRQITETEWHELVQLFPEAEVMELGLEYYLEEWDGEQPLLAPVLKENSLFLWWD